MAPCDPTARFVAGLLETEEGRSETAIGHLMQAARLDGRLFREVVVQLVDRFDRPDSALSLARDDLGLLSVLAEVLDASTKDTCTVNDVRQEVLASIRQTCDAPDAPAWILAWQAGRCRREGAKAEAIGYYRRALDADYSKALWHFDLAGLLADVGAAQEAIEEARTCLRLWPEHAGCKRLIERLTASP